MNASRTARAVVVLAGAGLVLVAAPADAKVKPRPYANCTALHADYPHGVGRKGARDRVRGRTDPVTTWVVSTKTYDLNTRSDRDKDGVACEQD